MPNALQPRVLSARAFSLTWLLSHHECGFLKNDGPEVVFLLAACLRCELLLSLFWLNISLTPTYILGKIEKLERLSFLIPPTRENKVIDWYVL